jgi:oxygen-dependent protoporphyrinogen oxidase
LTEASSTSVRHIAFRVAVIGGGVAGLTAAHRLRELAAPHEMPLDVAVYERGPVLGGPLRTLHRDGFVMEAGADSFLTEKPHARELAVRLGLGADLIPTREEFRRTFVVRNGRLVEIPEGFSLLAPSRLGPVLRSKLFSPWAKLRIALEPLIPARRDVRDESLASFVRRRLGREVLERVAQPLASGIYTADPERLSMLATMARFAEMEQRHGSLIRGMRAAERARGTADGGNSGARWSLFLSLRRGMGSLIDALAGRLGDSIRRNSEVAALTRDGPRWRIAFASGASETADAVICAAPAHAAACMLREADPHLAELLGAIRYASAAVVNLTFRAADFPKPPAMFGFVVPAVERRRIIAASFTSLKFERRAPDGFVVLRAFIGGELQRDMMERSDEELIDAAREEFRTLLGVAAAPGIVHVARWPQSMPQYEVGHLERVAEIERRAAALSGLALAGAALRGVGIPDCVRSGELSAESIVKSIARLRSP